MRAQTFTLTLCLTVTVLGVAPGALDPLAAQGAPSSVQAPPPTGGQVGPPAPPRPRPQSPRGQGQPPRDSRAPVEREGTGVIRGVVVDAATGQPLPRAQVNLVGRSGRAGGDSARTDAQGAFEFTKLPEGRYTLSVNRVLYTAATYPEPAPGSVRGKNLQVTEGQELERVLIPLHRTSAISGRVVDQFGDPVPNARIETICQREGDRRKRLMQSGGGMTNDIGEFRVARLQPGRCYLMVTITQSRSGMDGPGGLRFFSSSDGSSGAFIGAMTARAEMLTKMAVAADSIGFEAGGGFTGPVQTSTFYPGVVALDQATPIDVVRGQSVANLEFTALDVPTTLVSGMVVDAKGLPVSNVSVTFMAKVQGVDSMRSFRQSASTQADGLFTARLQPGEYRVDAVRMTFIDSSGSGRRGGVRMIRPDSDDDNAREEGSTTVMVSGETQSGITIALGTGAKLSGRLVFEGQGEVPTDFKSLAINMGPVEDGDDCRPSRPSRVADDGTFEMKNIFGTCLMRVGQSLGRWSLKAIRHRGTEITDRAIRFDNGIDVRDVQVVFTDRVSQITADVTDDRGAPATEGAALIFSEDQTRWRRGSRYIQFTTVSQGRATLRSVLPGRYYVIGLEDLSFEEIHEPRFLEALTGDATRVTVTEGANSTVSLRLTKPPAP